MDKAIVIHSLRSGGAERVASLLANAWADEGDRVAILCLVSQEASFYPLDSSIEVMHLDVASDSEGSLGAVASNVRRLFRIRAAIRKIAPRVTISFMTSTNVLTILACLGLPTRVIATEHIHPPAFSPGVLWEYGRKLTYRLADAVTAPTQTTSEWLETHTGAHCVRAIPNPLTVPLPTTSPVKPVENYVSSETHLILAVGRLIRQKGFDLLIEAASDVLPQYKNWQIAVLGEGPLRSELESLVYGHHLQDSVSLIGNVGNISDWYERAEVYVMSSRFEGFGNTLAEAMAHGCACISFDCDAGPSAIIRSEREGILIAKSDAEALRRTLHAVIEDEALRVRLQSNRALAQDRFSHQAVASQWRALMAEL